MTGKPRARSTRCTLRRLRPTRARPAGELGTSGRPRAGERGAAAALRPREPQPSVTRRVRARAPLPTQEANPAARRRPASRPESRLSCPWPGDDPTARWGSGSRKNVKGPGGHSPHSLPSLPTLAPGTPC